MPSARTSVGNKEYESKKANNELAVQPRRAGDRSEAVRFGVAAVAVALRHGTDTTAAGRSVSTVSFEIYLRGCAMRYGRLDVRTGEPSVDDVSQEAWQRVIPCDTVRRKYVVSPCARHPIETVSCRVADAAGDPGRQAHPWPLTARGHPASQYCPSRTEWVEKHCRFHMLVTVMAECSRVGCCGRNMRRATACFTSAHENVYVAAATPIRRRSHGEHWV